MHWVSWSISATLVQWVRFFFLPEVLEFKFGGISYPLLLILDLCKSIKRCCFCTARIRYVTARSSKGRIIPSVREIGNGDTQEGSASNIVDIMSVIFETRNGNQCRSK
jgi:hypothetical protein